jgi:hypothetical protein
MTVIRFHPTAHPRSHRDTDRLTLCLRSSPLGGQSVDVEIPAFVQL